MRWLTHHLSIRVTPSAVRDDQNLRVMSEFYVAWPEDGTVGRALLMGLKALVE